jgi:hypothetical protein
MNIYPKYALYQDKDLINVFQKNNYRLRQEPQNSKFHTFAYPVKHISYISSFKSMKSAPPKSLKMLMPF